MPEEAAAGVKKFLINKRGKTEHIVLLKRFALWLTMFGFQTAANTALTLLTT
jgi:hypothetical protein